MRPRVSVVIPTRNRAALLAQALDSVFTQKGIGTKFDLDVVVVDDASTDTTADVVGRYSSVRHIRLSRSQGVGNARNVGIEETAGTYVAFLDDDDLWLPEKLSLQVGALEAASASGVAYSQVFIGSPVQKHIFPERGAPSGALFHHLLFVNLCVVPAVLVRREALANVGGFGNDLLEDYDMWLRLARHVPFLFVPGIVAVYRLSTGGRYQTAVRSGEHETALRRIVENGLAVLPLTEASERINREARATLELRIAAALNALQLTTRAWQRLRAGLDIDGGIMLNPRNRASIASIVGQYAATFPSPVAAATRLWQDFLSALGKHGIGQHAPMRRLLADVYWEVAIAQRGGIGCRSSVGGAASAVARSLCVHPLDLRKWWALVRFMGRPLRWALSARCQGDVRLGAGKTVRGAGVTPGYTTGGSSTPAPSSRR
jgi:glycosyltransferase involved in cell wall biosynthesis